MNVPQGPTQTTDYETTTGRPWTHWVNLIAGVLLFIAPWVLGYSATNSTAFYDALVLGALIVVFALIGLFVRGTSMWTHWLVGILGILSFVSPWVLGYADVASAFWANIILGAIAVIFAAIGIFVRPRATAM
jgi:hypothetical protein